MGRMGGTLYNRERDKECDKYCGFGLVRERRGEEERITWKGLGGGGDGWEDRTGGYRVPYQEAISPLMPAALLPFIGHL